MDAKVLERFLVSFDVEPSTLCWLWRKSPNTSGYGSMHVNGRKAPAHRFSYQHFVGPVPDGLELDHLCRRPPCVNPDHLEAVDHRTNMLRGNGIGSMNASKEQCKNGHPFDLVNTYYRKAKGGSVVRQCRACSLIGTHRRRGQPDGFRGLSLGAMNAQKTHCIHGHAFDVGNTLINYRGDRRCRACAREFYFKKKVRAANGL